MANSLLPQLVKSLCGPGCVVNITINVTGIRTGEMKHFSPAGKETNRLAYWDKSEATEMAIWSAVNFRRACLGLEPAEVIPGFGAKLVTDEDASAFVSPIVLDIALKEGICV
jgi:hypothetical protein